MLGPIAPFMPVTMLNPKFPREAKTNRTDLPPERGRPANQQQPSPTNKEEAPG